jgi:uncharacterized membrane protein
MGGGGLSQGLYVYMTLRQKNTETNFHALCGIRTHHPNGRAVKTHPLDHLAAVIGIVNHNFLKITYYIIVQILHHCFT